MNILIVHNYYQIPGGEDMVVANEKNLLEAHDHTVVMYTRHNNELKQIAIVKKLLLPFTTIYSLKTYLEVKRLIKEQQINIVHVHNTLNLISPSVYYAALICKVPVVQTIHNFRLLCPGASFYRDGHICEDCVEKGLSCALKHSCYRKSMIQTLACVISLGFHRLTGIYGKLNYICLTEFNSEKLLQLKNIKPDKVFVKPNFVSLSVPVIPFDKRNNQFTYAGRLDKLKGVDILLKAWKKMGEIAPQLVICGTGPMEVWCKDYINKNNLINVKLLGFVPNDEVKQIIAYSKALILPTQWYEGFPMTIIEAFSVGTPVIGSRVGNVGSIIKEGKTGWLFDQQDIDGLVKCIQNNVDINLSVYETYDDLYTPINNYKKLMQIYNTAITSHRIITK